MTILALAPHADDVEFGCGGTLKRLSDEGHIIYYAAFSPCQKSMPEGASDYQLYEELKKSTKHLGIAEEQVITFDFSVREFPANRQQILEELILLKKELQPDLIFLPNSGDIHQDHQVIHAEGVRAFKHFKILGYELPWNSIEFSNTMHYRLEKPHLEAKIKAIGEYESQDFRPYKDPAFLEGLAKVRGVQVNAEFAEAFELIKWVI